ncbi:MAG TPA: hypothetical protein PK347_09970 [Burkholderiaceae bacterium]|nr:hypothetical protein [Burkholderiaceae bacterium]
MNRCFCYPVRGTRTVTGAVHATPARPGSHHPSKTNRLAACVMALGFAISPTAWSQTGLADPATASTVAQLRAPLPRTFPPKAMRAEMTVINTQEVQLNGKRVRLSPGSRIRSAHNALLVSGSLLGQTFVVNYTTDTLGQAHEIWILTAAEAAQRRAGSEAMQTTRPTVGEQ